MAGTNWTRKYTYDRWGNRTETRDAANQPVQQITTEKVGTTQVPTNRIATVADVGQPVQYAYDAAGNLTWDGVNTYAYDAANRMTRVYAGQTPSPETELARYVYDAANRRVMQEAGGQVRVTLWDGMHSISEFTGVSAAGAVLNTVYIYAGNRMIANEIDGILQYTHPDRLSVRMTTDGSSPNYVGQQWHYPFGEEETVSGSVDKHQFTNYERDEASGTDYAMNRQYGNGLGRFMQVDPIGGTAANPQSLNRFTYGANDPINTRDPLGLTYYYVDGIPVSAEYFFQQAGRQALGSAMIYPEILYTETQLIALWDTYILHSFSLEFGGVGLEMNPPGTSPPASGSVLPVSPGNQSKIQPDQLTSNIIVLREFYCLYKLGTFGTANTERAAWVGVSGGTYSFTAWPWSAQHKRESWKGPLPSGTVALVHTHPNSASARPSTSDDRSKGGDAGTASKIGLPVYVVHRDGIWKVEPNGTITQLYDRSWWQKLPNAEKKKCP